MRNKEFRCSRVYCVLFIVASTSISCSSDVRPPKDVTEIYIHFAQNNSLKESEYFQREYEVEGNVITNQKPQSGTKYKERFVFLGKIMPLVVKENGELSLPMRYFVIKQPFGQSEVRPWKRGDHTSIHAPCLYRFKLRTGEQGLVFAMIPFEGNNIWLYPGNLKPIKPSTIQEKYVKSLGKSIQCVELPDLSSLTPAAADTKQIIHSLTPLGNTIKGKYDKGIR